MYRRILGFIILSSLVQVPIYRMILGFIILSSLVDLLALCDHNRSVGILTIGSWDSDNWKSWDSDNWKSGDSDNWKSGDSDNWK